MKITNLSKIKLIFLSLLIFINKTILSEGFIAGTLVKTKDGYAPIEQLKENNSITSYAFKNKILIESKINKIKKEHYNTCIKLVIKGKEIITTPDHKFFCPLRKGCWIKARDIQQNDFVLSGIKDLVRIEQIYELDCDAYFYCLSIKDNHNYFVSEQDIFVHNIVFVLGVLFGFEVTVDIAAPVFVALGLWAVNSATKSKFPNNNVMANETSSSDILYMGKIRTTKEVKKDAENKGLKQLHTKQRSNKPGAPKENDPIFKDLKTGKLYSPDRDGHGGSFWKLLNKKFERIASCDKDLKIIRK